MTQQVSASKGGGTGSEEGVPPERAPHWPAGQKGRSHVGPCSVLYRLPGWLLIRIRRWGKEQLRAGSQSGRSTAGSLSLSLSRWAAGRHGGQHLPDALAGRGGRGAAGPVRGRQSGARLAALHRRHAEPHGRVQELAGGAAAGPALPDGARRGLRDRVSQQAGQGGGRCTCRRGLAGCLVFPTELFGTAGRGEGGRLGIVSLVFRGD